MEVEVAQVGVMAVAGEDGRNKVELDASQNTEGGVQPD
jgi:hypothetical protein